MTNIAKRLFRLSAVVVFSFCSFLSAKPIGADIAGKIAANWLKKQTLTNHYIKEAKNKSIRTIKADYVVKARKTAKKPSVNPPAGQMALQNAAAYYIISLEPAGFIICSGDDQLEPVICFSDSGHFKADANNPLYVLLEKDLRARIADVKEKRLEKRQQLSKAGKACKKIQLTKAERKWQLLQSLEKQEQEQGQEQDTGQETDGAPTVDDIRISPLLQSTWSQQTVCSNNCYNYYTPSNYPSGCVATAMAQLMYYHQYPTAGIGQITFTIEVNDVSQDANTRGGDGTGGAYLWASMPAEPSCSTTEAQRQAIGALTYDAGLSVNMSYKSNGSASDTLQSATGLKNTFSYTNAVKGYNNGNNIGANLNTMINPNLDAKMPVILGVKGTGGHAVVADGYGYNTGTLYHHLNMGWAGTDNAWYNLPDIDTSNYDYTSVYKCIYNVFVNETGEIISGRVTDSNNAPLEDVNVTATSSGQSYSCMTDANGIYAVLGLNSNTQYTITADKAGFTFNSQSYTTGSSQDFQNTPGNVWAADLQVLAPSPPVAVDMNFAVLHNLTTQITLQGEDEGLPDPPGKLQYIIVSLPKYGQIKTSASSPLITAQQLPYTLSDYNDTLLYVSPECMSHLDSFTFKVNDGGTDPNGGDSNTATATLTIDTNSPYLIYDCNFESYDGWTIIDGYSDGKTWNTDNSGNRVDTHSVWTDKFMIVDSDWAENVDMNEQLISPVIDLTGYANASVKFKHEFLYYSDEICDVDIKVDSGSWVNIARYQSASTYGQVTIDISSYTDNHSSVQLRWHYYNAKYEWYWGIDDVQVYATPAVSAIIGDINMDCTVNLLDFTYLAEGWLTTFNDANWDSDLDISEPNDNVIDYYDLYQLSEHWLD